MWLRATHKIEKAGVTLSESNFPPSAMRYYVLLFFLFCFQRSAPAQNLLANGSFEEENICTEYKMNCAPEAWIATSLTSDYYVDEASYAFDGTHFIGLITGNEQREGVRTFIRSRLLCGLRKGKKYKIDFYLRSRHAVFDSLGIYFSSTDFMFETRPYKQIIPSLWINDTIHGKQVDKNHWYEKSVLYEATGNEIFISIGSFKRNEYQYSSVPDRLTNYYVYLDKISIIPLDIHEKLCNEADSVKQVMYAENDRHGLLEKKRYVYRKKPPEVPKPPVTIVQHIDTLIIPDILFETASAKLGAKSFMLLDSFKNSIAVKNIDSIVFEGHTDSIGTLLYNRKLSADRSRAVADYMLQNSVLTVDRTVVRSYAYLKPLVSNATRQGRQRNRRVEIYLYSRE